MSNGITGPARDGRLPSIRLHAVEDGVIRSNGERMVTATQRDSLATEQAKKAREKVATFRAPERRADGIFTQSTGNKKAGTFRVQRVRTLQDEDNVLPILPAECATVVQATENHSAAAKRIVTKGAKKAQPAKAPKAAPTAKGTPRDYTVQDAIIRSSGYTGPITQAMRTVAGDVIAFRQSLIRP